MELQEQRKKERERERRETERQRARDLLPLNKHQPDTIRYNTLYKSASKTRTPDVAVCCLLFVVCCLSNVDADCTI